MDIIRKDVTVKELCKGYVDNAELGISCYDGKLDVRPPYQREFIYNKDQRDAVIDTVKMGFPLNTMYWAVRRDGKYEIIDGQQRTISLCKYVAGRFSIDGIGFFNLPEDKQKEIENYQLMIYRCSGKPSETLEWFRTINIAGVQLTDQELRNAVYAGTWTYHAKRHFSKSTRQTIGDPYLGGSANRQEHLETAIKWVSEGTIEEYMSDHQHDKDAEEIWEHFKAVIEWIKTIFIKYRREMKGIEFGQLYDDFKNKRLDANKLETEIATLMEDEDVTNKKGIYTYVLSRDEKHLNIRAFKDSQKREAWERQKGICVKCVKYFELDDMEADHVEPWYKGGKTESKNCQMLCKDCNRRKSGT